MGVRYIGSKARVAESIVDLVGAPTGGRFVDAFSGTGAVAAVAADRGWPVALNDSLPSAVSMSVGAVLGAGNVSFQLLGGYAHAIEVLNGLTPVPGFLHAEYSPASRASGVERRYFTEPNAARLDAMRSQIRRWRLDGLLSDAEEHLLLADLMQGANAVANISGTYGCFLKEWSATARKEVALIPRELPARTTDFIATVGDVFDVTVNAVDTVYYDPPYTKRQYSAYYHLLETLHAGDAPDVGGVTGLRPWQSKASEFSYKSKALGALTRLVERTHAHRVLLSYSNEGHVAQQQLVESLAKAGAVTIKPIRAIGRYRPNAGAAAAADTVNEYVIEVLPLRFGGWSVAPDAVAFA